MISFMQATSTTIVSISCNHPSRSDIARRIHTIPVADRLGKLLADMDNFTFSAHRLFRTDICPREYRHSCMKDFSLNFDGLFRDFQFHEMANRLRKVYIPGLTAEMGETQNIESVLQACLQRAAGASHDDNQAFPARMRGQPTSAFPLDGSYGMGKTCCWSVIQSSLGVSRRPCEQAPVLQESFSASTESLRNWPLACYFMKSSLCESRSSAIERNLFRCLLLQCMDEVHETPLVGRVALQRLPSLAESLAAATSWYSLNQTSHIGLENITVTSNQYFQLPAEMGRGSDSRSSEEGVADSSITQFDSRCFLLNQLVSQVPATYTRRKACEPELLRFEHDVGHLLVSDVPFRSQNSLLLHGSLGPSLTSGRTQVGAFQTLGFPKVSKDLCGCSRTYQAFSGRTLLRREPEAIGLRALAEKRLLSAGFVIGSVEVPRFWSNPTHGGSSSKLCYYHTRPKVIALLLRRDRSPKGRTLVSTLRSLVTGNALRPNIGDLRVEAKAAGHSLSNCGCTLLFAKVVYAKNNKCQRMLSRKARSRTCYECSGPNVFCRSICDISEDNPRGSQRSSAFSRACCNRTGKGAVEHLELERSAHIDASGEHQGGAP